VFDRNVNETWTKRELNVTITAARMGPSDHSTARFLTARLSIARIADSWSPILQEAPPERIVAEQSGVGSTVLAAIGRG